MKQQIPNTSDSEALISDSMTIVTTELRTDKEYYRSWHDSISMAYQDSGGSKEIGDKGAKLFLEWLTS